MGDPTPVTVIQDSKKEQVMMLTHALTSMNVPKMTPTIATLNLTAFALILLDPTPVTVIPDSKREKVKKKAIALTSMNVLTKGILVMIRHKLARIQQDHILVLVKLDIKKMLMRMPPLRNHVSWKMLVSLVLMSAIQISNFAKTTLMTKTVIIRVNGTTHATDTVVMTLPLQAVFLMMIEIPHVNAMLTMNRISMMDKKARYMNLMKIQNSQTMLMSFVGR